jgi:hypothetical protein
MLIEKLRERWSPEASRQMLAILKRQQDKMASDAPRRRQSSQ